MSTKKAKGGKKATKKATKITAGDLETKKADDAKGGIAPWVIWTRPS